MASPERILVADDDRAVVRLIQDHFERLGREVVCAYDGREALAALEQEDFDRVYLDVMRPYVDGFDLLNRTRHNPAKKDTWIALMSTSELDFHAATRSQCSADHFVQKPVAVEDLLP